MAPLVPSGSGRGTMLLADISGYTAFLRAVAQAHAADMAAGRFVPEAYPLLASLLDDIVERIAPPFAISKLEGDAVFSFAADDELRLRGPSFLACLATCYEAYRARLEAARNLMTCTCDACSSIGGLDLKFRAAPRRVHHPVNRRPSGAPWPRRHRGPPAHEEPRDRPHRAIGLRTPHRVSGRSPRSPTRARPPDR